MFDGEYLILVAAKRADDPFYQREFERLMEKCWRSRKLPRYEKCRIIKQLMDTEAWNKMMAA